MKLLNIRNIEQGLENIRRIPTGQSDFKLIPGENTGESKVEVSRTQGRPVRVMLSADDSGSRYTGKNQGTATLFIDTAYAGMTGNSPCWGTTALRPGRNWRTLFRRSTRNCTVRSTSAVFGAGGRMAAGAEPERRCYGVARVDKEIHIRCLDFSSGE